MSLKRQKISQYIAYQTLPWLVGILLISSAILIVMAERIIDQQLQERHQSIINNFSEKISNNIHSLEQQVTNIARNDLITNSLIDPDESQNYIPLFIRSFAFSGIGKAHISITDFTGETITSNGESNTHKIDNIHWKGPVLEQAQLFTRLTPEGLVIAAPIIFSSDAEGAVLTIIDFEQISRLLEAGNDDNVITLISDTGKVLYSSNHSILPEEIQYDPKYLSDWFQSESNLSPTIRIVSAENKTSAYSKFYLMISFIIAAIIISVFSSLTSTLLSSRLISKTLKSFLNSFIQLKSNQKFKKQTINASETEEIASIKHEFNRIIDDLFETRLVRDNIQSILNSLNEYLLVVNTKGETQMTNIAFERLNSQIASDQGQHLNQIIPEHNHERALDTKHKMSDVEYTYELRSSDNNDDIDNEKIIRWSRSLYYSEKGDLQGVIFIGTDITLARKIEKDLHIKNRAIEEASSGIVLANALEKDMPLVYVNKQFLSMTGYHYDEVIHKNCRFLQGENTDRKSIQRIRTAIKNNERITETFLNYRKDGSEFYNQLTLTPIRDQGGKVTHYLGIQFDATERVRFGNELLEAKKKAEESARLKSEFLASMSHEIRTPMNGVIGMLNLLESTQLDDKQARYTDLATSSAHSLLSLINDILDFSKVEAGKMELELIDFNLPEFMGEFAETMTQRAQEKGLELILDLADIEQTIVKGDPSRIRQIFTNLVSNAIKFTESGEIIIRAGLVKTENGINLQCSVSDTGIGIPANKIDSLFDSFSQVDASTTRKYGGTGLGLAIVKKLCQLMQGHISVSSNLAGGSEFSFTVKVEDSKDSQPLTPIKDLTQKTVLLVESNASARNAIHRQFAHWQLSVIEKDSALSAIEYCTAGTHSVDLVITNLHLPDMDGTVLATQLASHIDAPIVLLTPICQKIDEAQLQHIDYCCIKPAAPLDLLKALDYIDQPSNNHFSVQHSPKHQPPEQQSLENTETTPGITDTTSTQFSVEDTSIHEPRNNAEEATTVTNKDSFNNILLVEDNIINQEVALGILDALGYTADIANNGLEALKILNASETPQYNLILMDCQMPEMDGYEATRAIRSGKTPNPNIPIVAMTANAMKGDKEKCLTAGMDDYISKPVDPDRLQECLQHWLQTTPTNHSLEAEEKIMSEVQQIWDKDGFMKRVMNNESIADKLIILFEKDAPQTIDQLAGFIESEQAEEAGLMAHKLKGSASNLGGVQLAATLQKIEAAGKSDDMEEVKSLWPLVMPEYQSLMEQIHQR